MRKIKRALCVLAAAVSAASAYGMTVSAGYEKSETVQVWGDDPRCEGLIGLYKENVACEGIVVSTFDGKAPTADALGISSESSITVFAVPEFTAMKSGSFGESLVIDDKNAEFMKNSYLVKPSGMSEDDMIKAAEDWVKDRKVICSKVLYKKSTVESKLELDKIRVNCKGVEKHRYREITNEDRESNIPGIKEIEEEGFVLSGFSVGINNVGESNIVYNISDTASLNPKEIYEKLEKLQKKVTDGEVQIVYNTLVDKDLCTVSCQVGKIWGDVNSDNSLNIFDAVKIAKSTVGRVIFADDEKSIADFNNDGTVDIFDAALIAKNTVSREIH